MFGSPSKLRKLTVLAVATSIFSSTIAFVPAAAAKVTPTQSVAMPAAAQKAGVFLASKFVSGRFVEGFTPGKADFGFTIEAMLQRKAAGQSNAWLAKSIRYVLEDPNVTGRPSDDVGYLYSKGKIKMGFAGKFLFASKVLGANNSGLRSELIAELKPLISKTGLLNGSVGNSFEYAWLVMGLQVNGQTKLASRLSYRLAKLARPDGGFGFDRSGDTTNSSPDSTGIALQALSLTRNQGVLSQRKIRRAAVEGGIKYLLATDTNSNHWVSWGDIDVNGTAYAAMGLKAAGVNISKYTKWLRAQQVADGGLKSPWSAGAGDVYATAQAIVPMLGKSYLSLLK